MKILTERLVITEFDEGMAYDFHANSLDGDNREFVPDEVCETEAEALVKLRWLIGCYEKADSPLVYAVLLNGAQIGHVQACPIHQGWEIGYHIAKAHTGRGYATEATMAFLPWAMRRLGIGEIYGICRADNPASRRVLEKCGFALRTERAVCEYVYRKAT